MHQLSVPNSIKLKEAVFLHQSLAQIRNKYFLFFSQIEPTIKKTQYEGKQNNDGEDLYSSQFQQKQLIAERQASWVIIWGNYQKIKLNEVIELCQDILVQRLTLYDNFQSAIIKEVVQCPNYSKLNWLNIANNKIQSIEALQHLYAPQLKGLALFQNQIKSLLPLRKTSFVLLTYLSLSSNLINNLDYFDCCEFTSLNHLSMHSNYWLIDVIGPLMKSSIQKLQQLELFHSQLIKYTRMKQIVRKKHQVIVQ